MCKSACFTGHRSVSGDINELTRKLYGILEKLITDQNVTAYYCGGAYGWDLIAAQTVLQLKVAYPHIKLHFVLPCTNVEQTDGWTEEQKTEFQLLLDSGDSVEYVSEHKTPTCMKERNARLVELADYCISYYNEKRKRSGTGQTVRMAQKNKLTVINLY